MPKVRMAVHLPAYWNSLRKLFRYSWLCAFPFGASISLVLLLGTSQGRELGSSWHDSRATFVPLFKWLLAACYCIVSCRAAALVSMSNGNRSTARGSIERVFILWLSIIISASAVELISSPWAEVFLVATSVAVFLVNVLGERAHQLVSVLLALPFTVVILSVVQPSIWMIASATYFAIPLAGFRTSNDIPLLPEVSGRTHVKEFAKHTGCPISPAKTTSLGSDHQNRAFHVINRRRITC